MFINTITGTVDTYENWYADYASSPYANEMTFEEFWNGTLIPVIYDGYVWIEKP